MVQFIRSKLFFVLKFFYLYIERLICSRYRKKKKNFTESC